MEKWNNKKYFNFLPFCLIGSEKVEGWIKMSLYKFTHISLLKNDAQLKQKSDKQPKKKKKNHKAPCPGNKKKLKKKRRKRR